MRRPWQTADVDRLRDAIRQGTPYAEIARELDRTESAVTNAAHRFCTDLSHRRRPLWSVDQDQVLLERWAAGWTVPAIAAELGRTPGAVAERRRTLVSTVPRQQHRVFTSAFDTQLIREWRKGSPVVVIATLLKQPAHVIDSRIRTLRQSGEALSVRKPRWSAAEKADLAKRYREGATRRELMYEFERARGSIGRQLAAIRAAGVTLERRTDSD